MSSSQGRFSSLEQFQETYGDIQSASQVESLAAAIKPHILRRLKEDVEKSIPKKEETIIDVQLTMLQKQYYRAVFERNREFLCRSNAADGKIKGPKLLNLESQLRKCCNHPFLLEGADSVLAASTFASLEQLSRESPH